MRNIALSQNTVAQSLVFDNMYMYVCQIIQDGVQLPDEPGPVPFSQREDDGDIAINRLSQTGVLDAVMYVRGAGHGAGIAIQSDGLLWIDADASGSGFARALGRVTFQPGAVLDSLTGTEIFRPFGPPAGSHGLSVSIDNVNNLMAVRRTYPDPDVDGRRYYLYDLNRATGGDFSEVLYTVDQMANQPPNTPGAIGTFQGFTTLGNYFYTIEGNPSENNAYISRLNWIDSGTEQNVLQLVMSDLTHREPEGLTIWNPDGNLTTAKMVFGFASGTDNARLYNLAYIPVVKTIPPPETFGHGGYGEGGYGQ